ncbi:MAG TPA: cyclopropane fatty acyl phospholipid synthase, partial [Fibrobacteria bacterium]|nr:cyclopropane fatty acyl phospholipid synthase [Fibrobacteria bacterium]
MLGIQSSSAPSASSAPTAPSSAGERFLTELLASADIRINGDRPWDLRIHNPAFFRRVMAQGTLGLGESYMDGWWDCDRLDIAFDKAMSAQLEMKLKFNWPLALDLAKARLFNRQTKALSKTVAEQHYNLGNDFYADMLDPFMQYTCAYWKRNGDAGKGASTLAEAQENKLDLVCRKLGLKPGMTVLELGCGWGGFARFAAERYGAHVTAYNISSEQVAYGRERTKGLPVDIRLQDYREAEGTYDRIVSIGMCEHVGYRNYRTFFKTLHDRLKDGGLALVHTIGGLKSVTSIEPWLGKYIFPHAMLPSVAQLSRAMEGLFVVEDWHNFGPDYDLTLMAWLENFERNWAKHRAAYG